MITRTHKVNQEAFYICVVCRIEMYTMHVMYVTPLHMLFHLAALGIVKEVANHANDIMKQGVRAN